MKALDQAGIRARGLWQVARAVVGRPGGWGHLVIRLDDLDAPGPVGAPALDLDAWQALLVDVLGETGAVPVRIVARPRHPLLRDLARFVWRLECPVTVRTVGEGIDDRVAEGLVDAGVRRVILLDTDRSALAAFDRARRSRAATLDVVVEVPVGADLDALAADMRAAGADGLRVGAPWSGGPWDAGTRAWIEAAAARVASFHRTNPTLLRVVARFDGVGPGAPRERGHCAVGGIRVEIGPDGSAASCPFQAGAAPAGAGMRAALAAHRANIRACGRVCVHSELAGPTGW